MHSRVEGIRFCASVYHDCEDLRHGVHVVRCPIFVGLLYGRVSCDWLALCKYKVQVPNVETRYDRMQLLILDLILGLWIFSSVAVVP